MEKKEPASLGACVKAYTRCVSSGSVPRAYRGILASLTSFKSAWELAHPSDRTGALYQGYLDMSFVAVAPAALNARRLKASLVYLHAEGHFELWLTAGNRALQRQISEELARKPLNKYSLSKLLPGVDAVIARTVPPPYAFDEPEKLTQSLVLAAEAFVSDMAALIDADG